MLSSRSRGSGHLASRLLACLPSAEICRRQRLPASAMKVVPSWSVQIPQGSLNLRFAVTLNFPRIWEIALIV